MIVERNDWSMHKYQGGYEINDEQWEQIKNLLLPYQTGSPLKLSDLTMFNTIFGSIEVVLPPRDLPEERYGSWKTAYSRFCKWRISDYLSPSFSPTGRT